MTKNRVSTSLETLTELVSSQDALRLDVQKLKAELQARDHMISDLKSQLDQFWDAKPDVDYRGLVEQIRDDARAVTEKLRALDQRQAIRARVQSVGELSAAEGDGIVHDLVSLLRNISRWK